MMLPSSHFLASKTISCGENHNKPEENDETMSKECKSSSPVPGPDASPWPNGHSSLPEQASCNNEHRRFGGQDQDRYIHSRSLTMDNSGFCGPGNREEQEQLTHSPFVRSYCAYQPVPGMPAGYNQVTPFPSQAGDSWHPPSISSSWSGPVYPNSLPSSLSPSDYATHSGKSCYSKEKFLSLPGRYSPSMHSLEQPHSLHSNPPSVDMHHHRLSPYYCSPQGAPCCAQCPPEVFKMAPMPHHMQMPGHCLPGPSFYSDCRLPVAGFINSGYNSTARQKNVTNSTSLSLEQRKVFVTYEADSDEHINEIIKFVALLRTNGFDTHIDMFEQQFRSISKIDFMERYLSEKEYLIIIVISPKYYETVTASPVSLENDERTVNTVYIHKQLQNEFIQNGSKNYRFIPILFPGAKKCHVPTWLQNTHVYGWPQARDDILRRLMRMEKYNPPPVGDLPTIVPIPI